MVAPRVGVGPGAGIPQLQLPLIHPRNSHCLSSISQSWLRFSLEAMGAPIEVQLFVRSLYVGSTAKYRTELGTVDMFTQRSGVAQGCLASGWLFAVAFDAPLCLLAVGRASLALVLTTHRWGVWKCGSWRISRALAL